MLFIWSVQIKAVLLQCQKQRGRRLKSLIKEIIKVMATKVRLEEEHKRISNAIYEIGTSGHELHHTALERGYRRYDRFQVEEYDGEYGKGYKVHYPNAMGPRFCANNYHIIEYWIKK